MGSTARTVRISRDQRRCEETFRPLDLHRTASSRFASRSRRTGSAQSRSSIQLEHDRTAVELRGRTPRSRRDRATIAARSSRDRGAIEPRSSRDREDSRADLSPIDQQVIDDALTPRSTPDQSPIAARLWRKSWPFWRLISSPISADFLWN